MDLGCKLIVGSELREEPPSLPPSAYRGVCTEIFSTFLFLPQRDGMGRRKGQPRVGGLVCPHCTSTNAVSVFSLSLSRARTPVPTWPPGPPHARGQQKTGRSARARCGGGTSTLPAAHRSSPICLPHHRLLLPSPPGPQCSGRGEPQRLCLALGSRPRNATVTPGHQQILVAACMKTPEASAGPHRPGRLVCSCIKLSRVPSSHHPSVSPIVFPLPSLSPPAPSSLGSAQVNVPFPAFMDHQLTSHFLLVSFCVFI